MGKPLASGEIRSKDVAAERVLEVLPGQHRDVLSLARAAILAMPGRPSECEQQADRVSAGRRSTADWGQLIPAHRVCRLIPTAFVQVADPGRLCCRSQVALETGFSRRRRT